MNNIEIIHDHTFDSNSAETILRDFENRIKDKVFVAVYGLEEKMAEIVPPPSFSGWRTNCFDTYDIEEQFIQNGESLEIRNDSSHFDFSIGRKALSDLSEISDPGSWKHLIRMAEEYIKSDDPKSTSFFAFRKNIYNHLILPFDLRNTAYFSISSLDAELFLKAGISSAIDQYKTVKNILVIELDKNPELPEPLPTDTILIFKDNYRDFRDEGIS